MVNLSGNVFATGLPYLERIERRYVKQHEEHPVEVVARNFGALTPITGSRPRYVALTRVGEAG